MAIACINRALMERIGKMKKEDILLVFLYSKGVTDSVNEPISGRTRLIKLMFIFQKEFKESFNKGNFILEDFPVFFPWNFGPMSKDVLEDLEFFKRIKFIDTEKPNNLNNINFDEADEMRSFAEEYSFGDDTAFEYTSEKYSLSAIGRRYVEERLEPILTDDQWKIISELKKRFNSASLRNILEYVYSRYPDMTDKSIIKNQILGK